MAQPSRRHPGVADGARGGSLWCGISSPIRSGSPPQRPLRDDQWMTDSLASTDPVSDARRPRYAGMVLRLLRLDAPRAHGMTRDATRSPESDRMCGGKTLARKATMRRSLLTLSCTWLAALAGCPASSTPVIDDSGVDAPPARITKAGTRIWRATARECGPRSFRKMPRGFA